MELLFITLGGAILGLGARYLLPGRQTHGATLVPGIGVVVAAVFWVGLTWAGLKWNGGWIWVISLVGTAAVVVAADLIIGKVRANSDATLLHTLSKGAARAS